MPNDHSRLKELFFAACDLPPHEQSALIDAECAGDPNLRGSLEQLLAKDQSRDGILGDDDVVRGVKVHIDTAPPAEAPEKISRYTIKRKLGEGGMGIVWLAEQENPKRDVAVKVIRAGAMGREMRRRFEFEAAVLGRLQHPNIAQVYEAGMFDDGGGGKPFFAMEFVDGLPLGVFLAQHELPVRKRLELFMQVCDAVHHAHQRGVIHRDLKPANILVTDTGQPKILDFGVARATDSDMQVTTLQTDVGQLIGTVPYMSPEQITGRAHDIDTRSDVYALGVILYELLVSRLPYDLGDKSIVNAARVISETDPSPLTTVNRTYRGDLNTIVLKALEKDPERRYQSPQELAADVRRYLNDEPIVARPATTMYQLRKFARRNKALVGGVAAAVVILIGGIISTTIGMLQAQYEADRSKAINEFMTDIIVSIDPVKATPDVKLVDVLRDASGTVATRFADYPESRNEVHTLLGNAFAQLSAYPESLSHLKSTFEYNRDQFGLTDPRTLRAASAYLRSLGHAGRITTAISIGNEVLDALSDEERESRLGMEIRRQLVNATDIRPQEADDMQGEMANLLDIARRKFGDDDILTVHLANDLAVLLIGDVTRGRSDDPRADIERGADLLRFALQSPESFEGNVIEEARTRLNLASALVELGEFDEAADNAGRILEFGATRFGENHAMLGRAYRILADINWKQNNPRAAAEHWIQHAEIDRRRDGDSSVFALSTMSDALPILEAGGFYEKGEEYARILLREMGSAHGHANNLHSLYLARFRSAQGDANEAEQLFGQIAESPQLETNSGLACLYHLFIAEHLHAQGRVAEARIHLEEAQRARTEFHESFHPVAARLTDAAERIAPQLDANLRSN